MVVVAGEEREAGPSPGTGDAVQVEEEEGGDADVAKDDDDDEKGEEDSCDEWKRMVAYDIETTGLQRQRDSITVVCVFGYRCGKEGRVFNFLRPETFDRNRDDLLRVLDDAPRLASFNGVRFDAPFIQSFFGVEDARVGAWIQKTFDVWEICKTMLRLTFSMQKLLEVNGFQTGKLGSGLQAIEWAKHESTWPLLEKYCLEDARLTYAVSSQAEINLPLGYREQGLPDEVAKFMSTYKIVKKQGGQFQINIM